MIPDTQDYIIKSVGRVESRKDKFYHTFCNNCGADRGYLLKSQDRRTTCNKCSKVGSTVPEHVRRKMKKAAHTRQTRVQSDTDGRSIRSLDTYARDYGVPKEHRVLRNTMRSLLTQKLKRRNLNKNRKSVFDILGYSAIELKKHLESKFKPGMTWENYGRSGWHIDHITPDSWFSYSSLDDEGFKQSWQLDNLQPMWELDNLRKSNLYAGGVPFHKQ